MPNAEALAPKTPTERRRALRAANHARKFPHIVDELIRERAQNLCLSRWWPLYRFFLNKLLGYRSAVKMVDEAGALPATEAFDYVSKMLKMDLQIHGLEHLPKQGPFLMAINHPSGIADGVAVYDAIKAIRPDMLFFANRDAVRLNNNLTDILIPVEWADTKKSRAKSRETLVATSKAFKQGKAIIMFPSGRIAFMNEDKVLTEQPWMNSITTMARRYNCPIIPANLKSRNSWLYYWFWNVNEELRDMTLFHELLNKKGQTFKLQIGKPINPDTLDEDNDIAAAQLRDYVTQHLTQGTDWETFCKPLKNGKSS